MEYYSAIKRNKLIPFATTWMEPEILILSEVSQKEKGKPYYITYIWNLIYSTNEPFHRKENHELGEDLWLLKREGEGVGWIGSLGLIDANYCIWNG